MSRHASPLRLGVLLLGLHAAPATAASAATAAEPAGAAPTAADEPPAAPGSGATEGDAPHAGDTGAAGRSAHEAQVRRLLRAMGTEAMAEQVLRRTVDGLRQSLPQVPGAFWAAFEAGIEPGELLELQVPVYAEALSPEDVDGLVAFYESPLGQRYVAAQPRLVEELMAAGERWGQTVARRALQALEAEEQ